MLNSYVSNTYKVFANTRVSNLVDKIKLLAIALIVISLPYSKAYACKTLVFTGATQVIPGISYTYHNNLTSDNNSYEIFYVTGGRFNNGQTTIRYENYQDVQVVWDQGATGGSITCNTYNQGLLCGANKNQSRTLYVTINAMPNSISFTQIPSCTNLAYAVTANGALTSSPSNTFSWSLPAGWSAANTTSYPLLTGNAALTAPGNILPGNVGLTINTPWGSRYYSVAFGGSANPLASFPNSSVTICAAGTGPNSQTILDPAEAGTGPFNYSYSWKKGAATISSATGPTLLVKGSDIVNPMETYTVIIKNNDNGCSAQYSTVVAKNTGQTGWTLFPINTNNTSTPTGQQQVIDVNNVPGRKTEIVTEANNQAFNDGRPYYIGANGHVWSYRYDNPTNKWVNEDLTPGISDLATGSLAINEVGTARTIYYVTVSGKIAAVKSDTYSTPTTAATFYNYSDPNVAGVTNAIALKFVKEEGTAGTIYYKTNAEGISKVDIATGVITNITALAGILVKGDFAIGRNNENAPASFNLVCINKTTGKLWVLNPTRSQYYEPVGQGTWGDANNPMEGTHLETRNYYVYYISNNLSYGTLNRITFNYQLPSPSPNVQGFVESTYLVTPNDGYTGQFSINPKTGVFYLAHEDNKIHQVYGGWIDNPNLHNNYVSSSTGVKNGFVKMYEPNVFAVTSSGYIYSIFYLTNVCEPSIKRLENANGIEKGVPAEQTETINPEVFNASVFPNPVNDMGTVSYVLASASDVNISVTTILGEQVAVLENAVKPAGDHSVNYSASNLEAGMYIVRITVNGEAKSTTKLIVNK